MHDLDGNVIAEYDSTGTLITEYVWLDGRPLAVIADAGSSPTLYFVLTDHLERPLMLADESRTIVWQATYLPFGEGATLTGSATLNHRFPGQWFQMETGLHYNWHRHYDPSIGRYLQPDPLGMPDGPSRFAYVANSPLMKVDPEGLQVAGRGAMSLIPPRPPPGPPMCEAGAVIQFCRLQRVSDHGLGDIKWCIYSCPDGSQRSLESYTLGAANDNCPAVWSF